jgi:uncharacterized coiled-coil protein SlyX
MRPSPREWFVPSPALQSTATGAGALLFNSTGVNNTATGAVAHLNNTGGSANTASGVDALLDNTTGTQNTANGVSALRSNTIGNFNTASGAGALFSNTTGSNNIALGSGAGSNVTTASNVVCIGGVGGENVDNGCYIGSIFNATSSGGTAVFVNSFGKLGTSTSSRRFKEEIKPMERASEALFALKPVTFHYKKEIDPTGLSQFGLLAEDVEKLNPDLVVRDKDGKPYSVRYDQVNAMLLNEFLKEHCTVQEQEATIALLRSTDAMQEAIITQLKSTDAKQEATIAKQQKQIEALTAGLQKVSAQLEMSKPATQMVNNP